MSKIFVYYSPKRHDIIAVNPIKDGVIVDMLCEFGNSEDLYSIYLNKNQFYSIFTEEGYRCIGEL